MEFNHKIYREHSEHIRHRGVLAPTGVVIALQSLAAGRTPDASVLCSTATDGATTWEALWLVGSSLVYVKGSHSLEPWTGTDQGSTEGTVTGWVRPVSAIRSLRIDEQQVWTDRFQAREGSRIKWVVEFGDAELAVPDDWRFDDYGDADKFVAALRSTWGH